MEEVIVVDEIDELEEGEIADDVVPEIEILNILKMKPKKLPRRYTLPQNSINKHKIGKHKEKIGFKDAAIKKRHKLSCPKHSTEKYKLPGEPLIKTKSESCDKRKGKHHSYNSPSTIKCAFKNYTSPPRALPLARKNGQTNQNSDNDDYPKLLSDYKKAKVRLTRKNEKDSTNHQNGNLSLKCDSKQVISEDKKSNISPAKQDNKPQENEIIEKKNEESDDDDVEELRRIALATCAKRLTAFKTPSEDKEVDSLDSSNASPLSCGTMINHFTKMSASDCDNGSCDNYEIVDMDVDNEDDVNSNLFVIDRTPGVTEFTPDSVLLNENQTASTAETTNICNENLIDCLPLNHSESNDDFDAELLRAELIANMNSRKKPQSPEKCSIIAKANVPAVNKMDHIIKNVSNVPKVFNKIDNQTVEKEISLDVLKDINRIKNTFQKGLKSHGIRLKGQPKQPVKKPIKGISQIKSKFSKLKNNKAVLQPPQRSIDATKNRLIITLGNDDTTTDESEIEETDKNVISQDNVPVSSIEALISSARQKSDKIQSINTNSTNVSCLSKAQQEEYNSLKRILAEKEPYSVPLSTAQDKNLKPRLNLLAKKISIAKINLEKEISLRNQMEKEILVKKKEYMASKLRAQLLKERLHAAEKIRLVNLESWKKSSAKLDIIIKSIEKHTSLLILLETELSRNSPLVP
ncbi:hypothetical protein CDAR_103151 [Caerostris darwini]|uniref:Uncharacterized protein n=1 Tax=Caerostris darwini TaxID=1538125 RepID=A0AAV4V4G8_9ARAC|nr:hypothetical protein CDAR_103151 [Caerostris darwini]